jgi:hypothetical protein
VVLTCALFGAIVWVFVGWWLLTAASASAMVWIVLFCFAGVRVACPSWAHMWYRLTGRYAVDEIDA